MPSLIDTILKLKKYWGGFQENSYFSETKISCLENKKSQAPTILILHGAGDSNESFLDLGAKLAKTHRVIMLDLPGFGKSEQSQARPVSVDPYLDGIYGLVQQLKTQDLHLLGHSFGANLAGLLASRFPKDFNSLAMISATMVLPGQELFGTIKDISEGRNLLDVNNWQEFEEYLDQVFHHRPIYLVGPIKRYAYLKMKNNVEWNRYFFKSILAPFADPETRQEASQKMIQQYQTIQLPTLMAWGLEDKIAPPLAGKNFQKLIPHAQVEFFEKTGHAIHLEKTRQLAKLYLEFLSRQAK